MNDRGDDRGAAQPPRGLEPGDLGENGAEPNFKTDYAAHFGLSAVILMLASAVEMGSGSFSASLGFMGVAVFVIGVHVWVKAQTETPARAFTSARGFQDDAGAPNVGRPVKATH